MNYKRNERETGFYNLLILSAMMKLFALCLLIVVGTGCKTRSICPWCRSPSTSDGKPSAAGQGAGATWTCSPFAWRRTGSSIGHRMRKCPPPISAGCSSHRCRRRRWRATASTPTPPGSSATRPLCWPTPRTTRTPTTWRPPPRGSPCGRTRT